MARNSPPLIVLAFVSFLQGLAPEVRTPRRPASARATHPVNGALDGHRDSDSDRATLSLGHTPRDAALGRAQQFATAGAVQTGRFVALH